MPRKFGNVAEGGLVIYRAIQIYILGPKIYITFVLVLSLGGWGGGGGGGNQTYIVTYGPNWSRVQLSENAQIWLCHILLYSVPGFFAGGVHNYTWYIL